MDEEKEKRKEKSKKKVMISCLSEKLNCVFSKKNLGNYFDDQLISSQKEKHENRNPMMMMIML